MKKYFLNFSLFCEFEVLDYSHVPNCRGRSFSIFWKISPPISLYHEPFLVKNFYKANNPPLIIPTPFCAYEPTGRYSSVFFKLTPMPLKFNPNERNKITLKKIIHIHS